MSAATSEAAAQVATVERAGGRGALVARAVLVGGLVAGTLDIGDNFIVYGLWRGVTPVQILHLVASGLLGRAAAEGGLPTAALGLGIHFGIATTIVGVYVLASRKLPFLARHPLVCGALYGLLAYVVMNKIVVPLSAVPPRPAPALASVLNQLAIHTLGVGVPSALAARWLARREATGR
jgi:hypothetical protein